MKSNLFYISVLIITIVKTIFSVSPLNLRRSGNGFRVLMSKNYVHDIGDFLYAFLKSSKIDKKVKSLSNCLKNVSETLTTISYVTQSLSQDPNILNIMSFLSTMDQTYDTVKNKRICSNITEEVKSYLDSYIKDPKLGNGDSFTYFTNVLKHFDSNYKEIYFQLRKMVKLINNREIGKAGMLLGKTLRDVLRMNKIHSNFTDSSIVYNTAKFDRDAEFFKKHILDCEYAVGEVFPDIYLFFKNVTEKGDLIPSANDLIKSISEATRIFKCFHSYGKLLSILNN